MNYDEMREQVKTGDFVVVRSEGLISLFIRMVMGDGQSHVAVLRWDRVDDHVDLFVDEMREGKGKQMNYASTWCESLWRKGCTIQYVKSPEIITQDERRASTWLRNSKHIDAKYGWLTLPIIWAVMIDRKGFLMPKLAKLFRIDHTRMNAVCSVYCQRFAEAMGYTGFRLPLVAPGAFVRMRDGGGVFLIDPSSYDE